MMFEGYIWIPGIAAVMAGLFVLGWTVRSEEHTSELQSQSNLVCRLLLEKKKHTDAFPDSSSRPTLPRPPAVDTEHSDPRRELSRPLELARRTRRHVPARSQLRIPSPACA